MTEEVNNVDKFDEFFKIGKRCNPDHEARMLRAMRAYLGLNLTKTSNATGLTRETISRAENSRRKTYRTTIDALMAVYMRMVRQSGD